MDGDQLTPNIGPNAPEAPAPVPESTGGVSTPEQAPERPAEHVPSPESRPAGPPVSAPTPAPVVTPVAGTAKDDDNDAQKKHDIGATPEIAEDVNVIEMEWVNKAKQIIDKTKDNPHAQEVQVEQLQRDYLKKRYGKEIRASS